MIIHKPDLKILLIEDNQADYLLTRKFITALQKEQSITLDWCDDPNKALDFIKKEPYDLYLVDYTLGETTGLDIVEACHKQTLTAGPFILLSDFEPTALRARSLELGIYDHILKQELSASLLDRTITYALERFRTEQALKSEKEFNTFILSEIPYLVLSVDQNGLISTLNPAAINLLGKRENLLIGTPWKDIIIEEDREDIKYKITDNGEVSFETRIYAQNKDIRIMNWNILNKSLYRNDKNPTAFILSGKDITNQVKAEENERRRQKIEALGQLAGGVAHEINNLLQPILMSSQMVSSRIESATAEDAPALNEYIHKNMARIERNAKNAAKIVDDILLFSRGDQKETEELNIYDVLEESINFVRDMLPETIIIKTDLQRTSTRQMAILNKTEMIQIITNMLVNAAHAMAQNGEVSIQAGPVDISPKNAALMKLKAGHFIEINIHDQGHGISPENISHIFNPFFTTKDIGEGTGLGLSIVYKIIERWNGTIKVQSEQGHGTTFSMHIPLV